MKLQLSRMLLLISAIAVLGATTVGCKKKAKDADIKASIETALKADPMAAGTMVDVKDGVATISGECKDEMCKAACEKTVAAVKGVKSVVNNCTVMPAPPPPTISADDPLTTAVNDALKAFPGVSATVKDGIVSLTGQIAKADRQKLMMALQALKPKKVDVAGLTNK
jgi:hyperosmotically inducible periplasmic protein